MSHSVLSSGSSRRILAVVADLPPEQPWLWLAAGWADLTRAPAASIGYGLVFVVASYFVTLGVVFNRLFYLLLPLVGGFFLAAPALAMGLYEISRALESGEKPTLKRAVSAILSKGFDLTTMGAFLALVFLAWVLVANIIVADLSSGMAPNLPNALAYLFSYPNLPVLAVGTLVGGMFALIVFAVSAVSVPMLLDRDDVDLLNAMHVSAAVCLYNWRSMLLWAGLIGVFMFAGLATFYVGLTIAFPLIGHATWHAYRDAVRR